MQNKEVFIKTTKTARITVLKNENSPNTSLLIALHGYGQLSTFFARKFEGVTEAGFDVILPEGLNRFYLEGSSGRVGASWMTKEERDYDIEDNQQYLSQIIETNRASYNKIILLGFSQGGATAARFFFSEKTEIAGLILWASVFPPDLEQDLPAGSYENCHFVLGKEDPYFDEYKQKEVLNLYRELGMKVHSFDGDHDVDAKLLRTILNQF